MRCPVCGSVNNKTIDSRPDEDCINRRRACDNCGNRWTTIEVDKDQWDTMAATFKRKKSKGKEN